MPQEPARFNFYGEKSGLVREGKVKNYAEIAKVTGLTRARVVQLANLTLLSPPLQERLFTTAADRLLRVAERELRRTPLTPWHEQPAILISVKPPRNHP